MSEVKFDQADKTPVVGNDGPSVSAAEGGTVAPVNSPEETTTDWQAVLNQVSSYISLDVISNVFNQYKSIIGTILLFLGAIVAVKLTLAVLEVVHEIPLLAPFLELVGITYSTWFIYRYLWKAENRSELLQELNRIKAQVLGQGTANS